MAGILGLLLALAGCDGLGGSRWLEPHPPQSMTPWTGTADAGRPIADAGRVVDASPAAGDAGDAYLVMCRHYCDALAETWLYSCAGSSCSGLPPGSDLCFDDRCAPRLVSQATCFTQCDALDRQYRATCGTDQASARDAGLCPSPPVAHDALCRAGCQLAPDGSAPSS